MLPLSRRRFLQLAGMVAAGAALAACDNENALSRPVQRLRQRLAGQPAPLGPWPDEDAATFAVLNRLTFGPRPEERRRAAEIGLQAWIEEQLAPATIDDGATDLLLTGFDTLTMRAHELHAWSDKLFDDEDRATVPDELRRATLLRQIYSRRQLYEGMVEFWSDHFNISVEKGECFYLKTVDDREVIRPHALGKFRDLLHASAHSPAMLVYLDQHVSDKRHPNENYARELLELHTLGVDGGYTQRDVMELARALTGWTVVERSDLLAWRWRGDFVFDPSRHDDGVKTVLGMRLEPEGQREAERVLEALAVHPGTARFLTRKLARRFLGPDAPAELLARAAQTFLQTDGDIRAVLRVLLLDGVAALPPSPPGGEGRGMRVFKRPVNFVVSALRQLNAVTDAGQPLLEMLARSGQLPFGWPTPDGYPDHAEAWQGNLLPRWQFALALAQNEIEGTEINTMELFAAASPPALADRLATLLLGAPLPAPQRDSLLTALREAGAELPQVLTAGLLASPTFQWR